MDLNCATADPIPVLYNVRVHCVHKCVGLFSDNNNNRRSETLINGVEHVRGMVEIKHMVNMLTCLLCQGVALHSRQ